MSLPRTASTRVTCAVFSVTDTPFHPQRCRSRHAAYTKDTSQRVRGRLYERQHQDTPPPPPSLPTPPPLSPHPPPPPLRQLQVGARNHRMAPVKRKASGKAKCLRRDRSNVLLSAYVIERQSDYSQHRLAGRHESWGTGGGIEKRRRDRRDGADISARDVCVSSGSDRLTSRSQTEARRPQYGPASTHAPTCTKGPKVM